VTTPVRVGELRPSQLLYTYGVGSVIDLPNLSGLVLGLDEWDVTDAATITEPRLLALVRAALGPQVSTLRLPPYVPEQPNAFDQEWTGVGVPVAVFPRWLRCPRCNYLGPLATGLFTLKPDPYRPEKVRYEHGCTNQEPASRRHPRTVPARLPNGHLDEFCWEDYVHRGTPCDDSRLSMTERGPSGEATEVVVRCRPCGASRSMVEAFGESAQRSLPACRARHPHLAIFEERCDQPVRTILLGASNLWFPDSVSVLSVPEFAEPLDQKVAALWADLEGITGPEVLAYARSANPKLKPLAAYDDGELFAAIQAHRQGVPPDDDHAEDVLLPEWERFAAPEDAPRADDFLLRPTPTPPAVADRVEQVVLAERLREVVALIGFTRIDAPGDRLTDEDLTVRAPLSRTRPSWVPCIETRGEGVFVRFPEDAVRDWEERMDDSQRLDVLFAGHKAWRARRGLPPPEGFPGPRYVLLHTFSHVLMRELALEAGYGAASISERLYARTGPEPMAGVLLYTSASDSEGTLGGLVSLGEPDVLGAMIERALAQARLCSTDPLCAEHDPAKDGSTHGAACHACLFSSETSCERGNRYLDRAVLVDTLATVGVGYFSR
jgi:hypothetical protein